MTTEYHALIDKVERFTQAALIRRRADMACAAGCSACCQVWLSVNPVVAAEVRVGLAALPAEARARVAARGLHEQARQAAGATSSHCAMLEADGRCAIYAHRPLVCRTQGHALRYPSGFVPESAVRSRSDGGDVTHCPLNFTARAPAAEDVLDAERVDQLLAVVGHRYSITHGLDPRARVALSALAAHAQDG